MNTLELTRAVQAWKSERKGLPVTPQEVVERFPEILDPEELVKIYPKLMWKSEEGWVW